MSVCVFIYWFFERKQKRSYYNKDFPFPLKFWLSKRE